MNTTDDARSNERWSAIENTSSSRKSSHRLKKLLFIQDFNFGRHNHIHNNNSFSSKSRLEESSSPSSHAMLISAVQRVSINHHNSKSSSLGSSVSTISMGSFGSMDGRRFSSRKSSSKFLRYSNLDSNKSLLSLTNNNNNNTSNNSTARWKSTPPPRARKKRSTATNNSSSNSSSNSNSCTHHHLHHRTRVLRQGQRWAATVSSRLDSAAIDRPISAIQRKASVDDGMFHFSLA